MLESLDHLFNRLLKRPHEPCRVIPAEEGIQCFQSVMDSRFRGSDSGLVFFSILLIPPIPPGPISKRFYLYGATGGGRFYDGRGYLDGARTVHSRGLKLFILLNRPAEGFNLESI